MLYELNSQLVGAFSCEWMKWFKKEKENFWQKNGEGKKTMKGDFGESFAVN